MITLTDARASFLKHCVEKTYSMGVHSVTFQPKPTRNNQDRMVVEEWDDINGSPWLFLAVLDGHGGAETADYAASHLPGRIHATLREAVLNATQTLDSVSVSNILSSQVELFDQEIGNDVKRLCPKPRRLDEAQAQALINGPKGHVLRRANAGTTFAAALIDGERKNLWVVGLGDSSVVLSKAIPGGRRDGERFLTLHNTSTPLEYARIVLGHPSVEVNIMKDDRILGGLTVTRALGDFPFKLRSSYSKQLFTKLPSTWRERVHHGVTEYNFTPPYVSSKCEVKHVDLSPLLDQSPTLILYSDGVNSIIDGYWLFRKENRCTRDPAGVIGALLGDSVNLEFMQDVFDHEIELKWNGPEGNRAVELLGNILAGRDPVRMTQVLDPELLSDEGERDIYVDDTTIIVCPLS